MVAIYTVWCNLVRTHKRFRVTPVMAAGLSSILWRIEDVAGLIPPDSDRLQYGAETREARDLLRRCTALKITLTWPKENANGAPGLDDLTALQMLEGVQAKLRALTPQGEAQRWLQSRALQI